MIGHRKNHRYRLKQFFAPTAGLYWATLKLILGVTLFGIGLSLSFGAIITPFIVNLSTTWNELISLFIAYKSIDFINHCLGGLMLIVGFYLFLKGMRNILRRLIETFSPDLKPKAGGTFVRRQQLAHGPRIVTLGGGTGLSTILRGLKQHTSNITAVVTVTDDGGSSGRLVQELGIIPPGDLRNCLVALADDEKIMTYLFQHRFKNISGSLSGHSIGNLLIAALVEQSGGDFQKALNLASEVLAIRGQVIPSTLASVQLKAIMEDNSEIIGETKIVQSEQFVKRIFLEPSDIQVHPEVIDAIKEANLICVGPGSVYTSVIPNLLVPGVAEAIEKSNALKVYICNVMTQHGETDAFTAAEHVMAIQANVSKKVFDYVLVNTAVPSLNALEKYRILDQHPVEPDIDRLKILGFRSITGNFMSESDYVRHDPMRITTKLMDLLSKGI